MTKYTVIQSYSSDAFGSRLRGDVFETDEQDQVAELIAQGFVVEGEHNLAQEDNKVQEAYADALNQASQQAQEMQKQHIQSINGDYNQVQQQASQFAQAQSQIMRDSSIMREKAQAQGQQAQAQQKVNVTQVEPKQAQSKKAQANESK